METPKLAGRMRHFFESGAYRPWFAGMIVCMVLCGAWLRFSIPLAPLTNRDSGGYISPALAMLVDGTYTPSHRNFPYPGFIWLLLKTSGTFASITVAQHILGLVGGVVFWLAWLRLGVFLPRDWRITALHAVLGLGLVWGLLLSKQPVFLEHSLRPEAIYPFLISLHIFGAISFLERSLIRRSVPLAIWWGAFLTVVSFGLYVMKPIWGLALVSGGLPLLIALACGRGKWRAVPFAAGALGTVAGVALFVLPESILSSRRSQPVALISAQLFFVHADLIEREIRRDLANPGEPPFPREILISTADKFRDGLLNVQKPYRTLGFNPDAFMYGPANYLAQAFFRSQPGAADRFYLHYYVQAWREQPFQMLWKIFRELSVFYRCDGKITRAGAILEFRKWYAESAAIHAEPDYLKPYREWGPLEGYMAAVRSASATDEPYQMDLLEVFLSVINAIYVVVLVLFLAAGFYCGRKSEAGCVPPFWIGIWLFSYNFAITLTVALVHSMSIQRYTDTQFCLTLFSFCAGLIVLVSMLLSRFSVPCASAARAGSTGTAGGAGQTS
ncbi:MAG: hypothetical protein WCS65_05675 [Verrucomicrobiae bacterium]